MTEPSLFDVLNEHGGLLLDRPQGSWCPMDAEMFDQWEQMGGVPADLSTVEALVRASLRLWREHKSLRAAVDDLIGADNA